MIARTREGREVRKGTFCFVRYFWSIWPPLHVFSLEQFFMPCFAPPGLSPYHRLSPYFIELPCNPRQRSARSTWSRQAGDTPLCLLDILALLPAMPELGALSDCLLGVACCWVSGRADSLKRRKSQLHSCRFKFRIFHHMLHEVTKLKCLFIPKMTV